MNELETDWRWLHEYIECGSQEAFARLVAEHLDMVYSACLRQLRDRHLAEDATQAVFVVLAGKGRGILPATPLSAWLYNAARLVCANVRKVEARRKYHEAQVAVGARQMMPAETNWDEIDLLAKSRAEDERLTTTYGWMDKSKGIVRLPIEVAMQKLIKSRT